MLPEAEAPPWMVVGTDLMHGSVSGWLWKMQPARNNDLLETCSWSFLLSSLPGSRGEQESGGWNTMPSFVLGWTRAMGVFELLNSNSAFPAQERSGWVVVAQTHMLPCPTSPRQTLPLWPPCRSFAREGTMLWGNCLGPTTLYLVFSFYQFCEIPKHGYGECWVIMLLL